MAPSSRCWRIRGQSKLRNRLPSTTACLGRNGGPLLLVHGPAWGTRRIHTADLNWSGSCALPTTFPERAVYLRAASARAPLRARAPWDFMRQQGAASARNRRPTHARDARICARSAVCAPRDACPRRPPPARFGGRRFAARRARRETSARPGAARSHTCVPAHIRERPASPLAHTCAGLTAHRRSPHPFRPIARNRMLDSPFRPPVSCATPTTSDYI